MAELHFTPRRPTEECIDLVYKIEEISGMFHDLHVEEVNFTKDSKFIKICGSETKLKNLQRTLLHEGLLGEKIITDKELKEKAKKENNNEKNKEKEET